MKLEVRFFNAGYCRQLLALVDRQTWKFGRFHAVVMAIHHPDHGWIIVDTGYGGRFHTATAGWPFRLYRWATPVTEPASLAETLRGSGIDPETVRHVVITHFHADHIGGLADLPQATIYHHADARRTLERLSPLRQVRAAYLPALMTPAIAARCRPIAAANFAKSAESPWPRYDLFGDGTIQLVDLPGHAPGHIGVWVQLPTRTLLYAADAYWDQRQINRKLEPYWLAQCTHWDLPRYRQTIAELRDWHERGETALLACHAQETQHHMQCGSTSWSAASKNCPLAYGQQP